MSDVGAAIESFHASTQANMDIFKSLSVDEHEQVVFCCDKVSRLRGIIAIHDTTLGPAIGGIRFMEYASEEQAFEDALRISKAMTYKSSAAGLNLGGGQGVIIDPGEEADRNFLFRSFGRFVDSLSGRFIAAEDVGTSVEDMEQVRQETAHVVGISRALGGSGDPGPVAAAGVFYGILACAERAFGEKNLEGISVAIQGVGHVGFALAEDLKTAGCKVYIADVDGKKAEAAKAKFGAEIVPPEKIYSLKVDIFSPCALGGIINDKTIEKLNCRIVAGAANNQLQTEKHGDVLQRRGILYAPDFIIGAGGLINVVNELEGYNQERALKQAAKIYDILLRVFEVAERENLSTSAAANLLAEERLQTVKKFRGLR